MPGFIKSVALGFAFGIGFICADRALVVLDAIVQTAFRVSVGPS